MAIAIVAVTVPSFFIYNPDHGGNPRGGPPSASYRRSTQASAEVYQKLYILFMIPGMMSLMFVVAYWSYYRPLRFTLFSMNAVLEKVQEKREYGWRQLQECGLGAAFIEGPKDVSVLRFTQGSMGNVESRKRGAANRDANDHLLEENACSRALICSEIRHLRLVVEPLSDTLTNATEKFLEAVDTKISGANPKLAAEEEEVVSLAVSNKE